MAEGRGEDPIKASAARVTRFLHQRKRYAGRERIMAVDGQELKASDLATLVAAVQDTTVETMQMKGDRISAIPYGDEAWVDDDHTIVVRRVSSWRARNADD